MEEIRLLFVVGNNERKSTNIFSRGCAGTGTIMTAHNSIFMGPIKVESGINCLQVVTVKVFGSEEQKMEILPSFVTGEKVGKRISLITFIKAQ